MPPSIFESTSSNASSAALMFRIIAVHCLTNRSFVLRSGTAIPCDLRIGLAGVDYSVQMAHNTLGATRGGAPSGTNRNTSISFGVLLSFRRRVVTGSRPKGAVWYADPS